MTHEHISTIGSNRKTIKFKIAGLALLFAGLFVNTSAQAQVNVNINIGSQAVWGPVGYDYVDYYYLPEVDAFYYVPTAEFIYWSGPRQITATFLPPAFHVDLYSTYKVIVNEPKPYLQHNTYIVKYAKYKKGGPKQHVIRDSNDQKYYAVKGHPKHGNNNGKGGNGNSKNCNKSENRVNQPARTERKAENQSKTQSGNGGKSNGGNTHEGKSNGGNGNGGHKKGH
ncbi:MAG: hypothetical protein V4608_13265 [Bacteroidota bacterium]